MNTTGLKVTPDAEEIEAFVETEIGPKGFPVSRFYAVEFDEDGNKVPGDEIEIPPPGGEKG